jgi:hypothetical protein
MNWSSDQRGGFLLQTTAAVAAAYLQAQIAPSKKAKAVPAGRWNMSDLQRRLYNRDNKPRRLTFKSPFKFLKRPGGLVFATAFFQ